MREIDLCIARRTTLEEIACHDDQGEVRSVETLQVFDKTIPTEREFRNRVPIDSDLGQPVMLLWYCDHFPKVRFKTAQEAAMLCDSEGYGRQGRMWVEVYEFKKGTRRKPPAFEWAYKVEMDPLLAEPVSEMLDYNDRPIEE